MTPSSAMSNVTPCPTAGGQVIHNVMAAVTSATSDAACRTVQLCLFQQTQGEIMCVCCCVIMNIYCEKNSVLYTTIQDIPSPSFIPPFILLSTLLLLLPSLPLPPLSSPPPPPPLPLSLSSPSPPPPPPPLPPLPHTPSSPTHAHIHTSQWVVPES